MNTVQIPEEALDKEGKDVLEPLKTTLTGLNVLGEEDGSKKTTGIASTFISPPDSVAIIEAGATSLSKWWVAAVGALGGTAAITAGVTSFWSGQAQNTRVALVGGVAGVLVAAILGVALMVSADVKGRAYGAGAVYDARASIANEFLRLSMLASRPPVQAAQPIAGKPANGSSHGTDALTDDELMGLLIRGGTAIVRDRSSNTTGQLSGIRPGTDSTEFRLSSNGSRFSSKQHWCDGGQIELVNWTYP